MGEIGRFGLGFRSKANNTSWYSGYGPGLKSEYRKKQIIFWCLVWAIQDSVLEREWGRSPGYLRKSWEWQRISEKFYLAQTIFKRPNRHRNVKETVFI